jgi:hypothetical protein
MTSDDDAHDLDSPAGDGQPASAGPASETPTLLQTLVDKYRLAAGLVVAAIALVPNVLDVPFVSRAEVWGAVIVFGVHVVAASLTRSRAVLACTTVAAAAIVGVLLLEVHLPDESGKPAAAGTVPAARRPPPQPRVIPVGSRPLATLRAFGRRWVLHRSGTIDGLSDDGTIALVHHVPGPAAGFAACGGALVVTHGHVRVTRVSPVSGRTLTDYRFGSIAGDVVCEGGFVWVTKPDRGSVVKLDARTLAYVDEFPVAREVTSITYGRGDLGTRWGTATGRRRRERHQGVARPIRGRPGRAADPVRPGLPLDPAPRAVVPHAPGSRRPRRDRPRDSSGPLSIPHALPQRRHLRGRLCQCIGPGGGTSRVRPLIRPIELAAGSRLVDADEFGRDIVAVDVAGNRLVTVTADMRDRFRAPRGYTPTRQCPTSGG